MENSSDEVKDVTAPGPRGELPAQAAQDAAPAQEPQDHPPAQDDWEEASVHAPEEPDLSQEPAEADAAEAGAAPAAQEAQLGAPADAAEQAQAVEETQPPDQPTEAEQAATVEAVLFAADAPLPPAKLSQVSRLPQKAVRAAVATLNQRYEQVGAAFRVEEIAGGLQMLTLGKYHEVLERLFRERSDSRLSQAALETLAVVAYRQPVLRADIEAIRGVACGEVLRGLMEKQLIRIDGRAQILGRPLLYGTTRRFLEVFGLGSLEDLPKSEELRMPAQKPAEEPAPIVADAAAAPQPAPEAGAAPAAGPSGAPEVAPAPTDAAPEPIPSIPTEQSPPAMGGLPVSKRPPGLCPGVDLDNTAALTDVMEQGEEPV